MTVRPSQVLIIGAGHAGGSVAAALRQFGWTGSITLLGEEAHPPYQRPPLSKAWLMGSVELSSVMLRPEAFYLEQLIELRLDTRVLGIEPERRRVVLADGSTLRYDYLIIATGTRPRQLSIPGAELGEVSTLRTLDDAERLRQVLSPGKRLAIIGGGYIGLETAASARACGAEVIVIERESRLLARVAHPLLSTFFQEVHEGHGVEFVMNSELVSLSEGAEGQVGALMLRDGQIIECDQVLVGIGAQANDELALAAGMACDNGILVDEFARTSLAGIYAVGDVTRRPLPHYEHRLMRLESVANALEQARQASVQICGGVPPAAEVPWFWSDQYQYKLQIAGIPFGANQCILRGNPQSGKFALFHLADARLVAVESVNSPADFLQGKALIDRGAELDTVHLADPACSLKSAEMCRAVQ